MNDNEYEKNDGQDIEYQEGGINEFMIVFNHNFKLTKRLFFFVNQMDKHSYLTDQNFAIM